MAIAPEPFHHACLEVLRYAIVQTRARANTRYPHEQLAALMDAVHNIPREVENWAPESEGRIRGWLASSDKRWKEQVGSLSNVFDEALGHRGHARGEEPLA